MGKYLQVGDRLTIIKEEHILTNGMTLSRGSVKLEDSTYPILPNGLLEYPVGYLSRVINDGGILSGVIIGLSDVWLFDASTIKPNIILSNVEVDMGNHIILSGSLRAVTLDCSKIVLNSRQDFPRSSFEIRDETYRIVS